MNNGSVSVSQWTNMHKESRAQKLTNWGGAFMSILHWCLSCWCIKICVTKKIYYHEIYIYMKYVTFLSVIFLFLQPQKLFYQKSINTCREQFTFSKQHCSAFSEFICMTLTYKKTDSDDLSEVGGLLSALSPTEWIINDFWVDLVRMTN